MAQYKVMACELKHASESLRCYNRSLNSQIHSLSNQEHALSAQWEGEARNAFDRAFKTDKVKFEKFVQTVDKFAATLEQVAEIYAKAECKNVQIATTRK